VPNRCTCTVRSVLTADGGKNEEVTIAFDSLVHISDWSNGPLAERLSNQQLQPTMKQRVSQPPYAWLLGHPLSLITTYDCYSFEDGGVGTDVYSFTSKVMILS
jgi:hypothetical protein